MSNVTVPGMQGKFVVFDTETTGLYPYKGDHIIEIACAFVDNGELTGTWSTLVNPGPGISPGMTDLHGITREQLDDAPSFSHVVGQLFEMFTGRVLVAHNMKFDWGFLRAECRTAGVDLPKRVEKICTLEASRVQYSYAESHRLGDLMEMLDIPFTGWHAAEADVAAAAKLLLHLMEQNPTLRVSQSPNLMWPDVSSLQTARPLARAS